MKLPFLGRLRPAIVENSRRPTRRKITASAIVETSMGNMPGQPMDDITVSHTVSVWFSQRVSVQEWNDLAHRDELARRSSEYIARHLYGPLVDRLLEAREELWKDGLGDHQTAEILTDIIESIRSPKA